MCTRVQVVFQEASSQCMQLLTTSKVVTPKDSTSSHLHSYIAHLDSSTNLPIYHPTLPMPSPILALGFPTLPLVLPALPFIILLISSASNSIFPCGSLLHHTERRQNVTSQGSVIDLQIGAGISNLVTSRQRNAWWYRADS